MSLLSKIKEQLKSLGSLWNVCESCLKRVHEFEALYIVIHKPERTVHLSAVCISKFFYLWDDQVEVYPDGKGISEIFFICGRIASMDVVEVSNLIFEKDGYGRKDFLEYVFDRVVKGRKDLSFRRMLKRKAVKLKKSEVNLADLYPEFLLEEGL